jgi:hypothetical protein
MTQTQTIVDAYFEVWNEADASVRLSRISDVWTVDAHYIDPMFAANGLAELDALVAGLHQQYPGHYFRCTTEPQTHHDRARWSWDFLTPDGAVVMSGVDFAILAPDGKLRDVTGFFEARGS